MLMMSQTYIKLIYSRSSKSSPDASGNVVNQVFGGIRPKLRHIVKFERASLRHTIKLELVADNR